MYDRWSIQKQRSEEVLTGCGDTVQGFGETHALDQEAVSWPC